MNTEGQDVDQDQIASSRSTMPRPRTVCQKTLNLNYGTPEFDTEYY